MDTAKAVGFSISYQFDEKRSIVAQTHTEQGAPRSVTNAVLDDIMAVVERQATKLKLEGWKEKLADDRLRLGRLEQDYKRIGDEHLAAWQASNKKGPFKLDTKQAADKRNAESTIERYLQEIALDEQRIKECEAKLKGDGP